MIFVVDVGFVCNKATGQSNGQLRAKALILHHIVATSCTAATKSSSRPGRCPSYSGPAAGTAHSTIRMHQLQLIQRSASNQQGSLGNSKRFISTFVPSILFIVLVNVDQLAVIWLQNEHTQKTLSPHLLLTSPVKRRSQRNASALPTFAIASIPGAPSIRKSHISSSRQLI